MVLEIKDLKKSFKTAVKEPGFTGAWKNLVKREYRSIPAVDGLNLEVEKGDILAFIGPNGAGKSTTIKLMTGILYPDSGSISVLGLDPHKDRKKLVRRIGTVFGQKSQLWYHLPAADSFLLLGSIYGMDDEDCRKRIAYLTEIFQLEDFLNQPVRKLSLGQRIRCEIAASLIHSPEILFLDEPSIGLDVVVKHRLRDLIKRINEEDGVTIFLTSHDAGDIEKLCRRSIVINEGKIVWSGSVKDMKYSLLNKRIIDVKLDNELVLDHPGVRFLKKKDYSAKLEADLNQCRIEEVMNALVRRNNIEDINVSTVPMEEIISHIYKGKVE